MNIGGPKRFTQFHGLGELGFGGSSNYKIVPGYLPQGLVPDYGFALYLAIAVAAGYYFGRYMTPNWKFKRVSRSKLKF